MKITVEVDCTPEEARAFLGLPDVKPLQEAAMEKLRQQMAQSANALAPEALLKTWLSFVPQNPDQLRDVMGGLFRSWSVGRQPAKADETPGPEAPTEGKSEADARSPLITSPRDGERPEPAAATEAAGRSSSVAFLSLLERFRADWNRGPPFVMAALDRAISGPRGIAGSSRQ